MNTLRDTLYQLSFAQDKQLYIILDAARVEKMPAQLFELEDDPEYFSLFFDTPQAELIDVAPYLVKVDMESRLLAWMLDEGRGQSWGIFLTAAADVELEQLLEHLRSFLKVKDPDDKELFFRFYDPRVLRIFMPTCNAQEMFQFFGPVVNSYLAENDDAKTLLQFSKGEQGLEIKNHTV
ncbi:hypothetical protein PN36_27805 [Candidatus Thiomargarita nelsonii]|uniref:DUF4123 domain-containing protein n=1 Tax=Candidatus Thiomargarita nelsonii TaxID=1003181 RepID=A0A4E0QMA3_9GAMM|nr:hypothetical protein PN36_27805 [Candidatus Thiomargarita nelsonii]